MTIKFQKSDRRFNGKGIEYQSINGWHDSGSKCARNVGKFKVYSDHFDCAAPYTNYYVADTETGEVVEYKGHYTYMGSALSEIVEQVREHGFKEPPAPQADTNGFNPLAYNE